MKTLSYSVLALLIHLPAQAMDFQGTMDRVFPERRPPDIRGPAQALVGVAEVVIGGFLTPVFFADRFTMPSPSEHAQNLAESRSLKQTQDLFPDFEDDAAKGLHDKEVKFRSTQKELNRLGKEVRNAAQPQLATLEQELNAGENGKAHRFRMLHEDALLEDKIFLKEAKALRKAERRMLTRYGSLMALAALDGFGRLYLMYENRNPGWTPLGSLAIDQAKPISSKALDILDQATGLDLGQ